MKKFCFLFCFVLSLLTSFFCFANTANCAVYAETLTFTAQNYASYDMNGSLFSSFCALASAIREESVSSFSSSFFSPNKREYEEVAGSGEQATLIVSDLNSGLLDLTTGENAKYDCLKNKSSISSLSGLVYMDLAGVTKLVLNDNNVSQIEGYVFSGIPTLTQIEIKNNSLTSFSLSSFFDGKISNLNLSHNALDNVSLNCTSQNAIVDLSFNSISSIDDISTTNSSLESLDLSFNNLSTFDSAAFVQKFGCVPFVFVQGLKDNYSFCDRISVNNDSNYNFKIHIKYSLTSKMRTEHGKTGDIVVSSGEGFDGVSVPAGKINIYFTYDSLPAGVDESLFAYNSYGVSLPVNIYEIYEKGTKTTKTDLANDFSVHFLIDTQDSPNSDDIISFAQTHSFINASTEDKGDIVNITSDGDYTFVVYSIFDDIESEHLTLFIRKHNATAIFWAIMLLFFMIITIIAYFVLRRWFRAGGNVAPLSSSERRMISRFSSKDSRDNEDYIDLSDKN